MGDIYKAIQHSCQQCSYNPEIEGTFSSKDIETYVVIGMGGSNLAADLIKAHSPFLDLRVHRDYGLPKLPQRVAEKALFIVDSYSGNTEEVLNALQMLVERKKRIAIVTAGGKLFEIARAQGIAYIKFPDPTLQPRSAFVYQVKALLKFMGRENMLEEVEKLSHTLHPEEYENEGQELAEKLKGKVPVIYASRRNEAIAYNWKIRLNETGKIPSFYNVFPELNHNEMTGFDVKDSSKRLSDRFLFIILKDRDDNARIQKRMEILKTMYEDRGLSVQTVKIRGEGRWLRLFSSIALSDWVAFYTARQYGLEAEAVPMIDEFKRRMQE